MPDSKLTEEQVTWIRNFGLERGPGRHLLHRQPGETIFEKGDEVSDISLVLRGQVKVLAISPAGRSAVHEIIGRYGWLAGEAINGMMVHVHSAIAIAENTELLCFDRQSFPQFIEAHQVLRELFTRGLGSRLHEKGLALDDVIFNPAPVRLARWLLELFRGKEALVIDLNTTQIKLAELIGTSRQHMNSIITTVFVSRGILEPNLRGSYRLHRVPLEKYLTEEARR
jgi:CRP-like cAMP-binding protein